MIRKMLDHYDFLTSEKAKIRLKQERREMTRKMLDHYIYDQSSDDIGAPSAALQCLPPNLFPVHHDCS